MHILQSRLLGAVSFIRLKYGIIPLSSIFGFTFTPLSSGSYFCPGGFNFNVIFAKWFETLRILDNVETLQLYHLVGRSPRCYDNFLRFVDI